MGREHQRRARGPLQCPSLPGCSGAMWELAPVHPPSPRGKGLHAGSSTTVAGKSRDRLGPRGPCPGRMLERRPPERHPAVRDRTRGDLDGHRCRRARDPLGADRRGLRPHCPGGRGLFRHGQRPRGHQRPQARHGPRLDDGGSPTQNADLARTLVQQDHVFAVVGVATAFFSARRTWRRAGRPPSDSPPRTTGHLRRTSLPPMAPS